MAVIESFTLSRIDILKIWFESVKSLLSPVFFLNFRCNCFLVKLKQYKEHFVNFKKFSSTLAMFHGAHGIFLHAFHLHHSKATTFLCKKRVINFLCDFFWPSYSTYEVKTIFFFTLVASSKRTNNRRRFMKKSIERSVFSLQNASSTFSIRFKISVSDVLCKICLKIARIPFSLQLAGSPRGSTGTSLAHFRAESVLILLSYTRTRCDNFLTCGL